MIPTDINSDIAATQNPLLDTYSSSDDATDILVHIRQFEKEDTFFKNEVVSIPILPNVNVTATANVSIAMAQTKSIIELLKDVMDEKELYRDVIKNLWKVYKYHQEYQSFILGGCAEEEFVAVAEQYATIFRQVSLERLTWSSLLLLNILDNYLTSSDLSVLLNVDPLDIENALASSSDIIATQLESQDTNGK